MAYTLINHGKVTSKTKTTRSGIQQIKHKYDFSGDFEFKGTKFTYEVIIAPFSSSSGKKMKKILLNRKDPTDLTRTKICLGLTKEDVKNYADNKNIQTSAFFIVYAPNKLDSGSGTIQVYNHCSVPRVKIDTAQVWINDVCRSYPVDIEKSKISPVEAMFYLMEQLVVKNLKKTETHLMVAPDNKHVMGIYLKYGYKEIPDSPVCDVAFDNVSGNRNYHIMNKSGLQYDGLINDELFNIDLLHTAASSSSSSASSSSASSTSLMPTLKLPTPTILQSKTTSPKKSSHGGNKRKSKTHKTHTKRKPLIKRPTKKTKRAKSKY